MDYKAEPVELGFGKGVAISRDGRTYEQIPTRDGLTVRLFQAPYEKKGQIHNTDYHGIIFRPSFDDTDKDFQVFKDLTDRLTQASGEEIRNSESDFMGYISHKSFEQDLERIGVQVRYHQKDAKDLPTQTNSFLNKRSHLGGAVTSLAGYVAGFALVANFASPEEASNALTMYGVAGPFSELLIGMIVSMISEKYWCGPMHAPGFIASRILQKGKLHDPNYVLGHFMDNYQKLDAMKDVLGNQKRFAKISKKADRFYSIIQELFPFTTDQRGFSVHYQNSDREKVVELFSYLLEGGNVPQLTVQTKKTKKQKQKPIGVQPVQTDFLNPWEIEFPEIGDKK